MYCTVATADSHLSDEVIHVTMLTSSFNAHSALGTGTLASLPEHLSAKTAKNKPCLRGSISQVLIKEVQGAVKEKEHNTDVRG